MGEEMMADWLANQGYNDGLEAEASRWDDVAITEHKLSQKLRELNYHSAADIAHQRAIAACFLATEVRNRKE